MCREGVLSMISDQLREILSNKLEQDAARHLKNEYQREWRKNNPEKVREYRERYWQKLAKRQKEMFNYD